MNEVEKFIERRWSDTDAHWSDGNCYWFAQILVMRFSYLQLYYLPVQGHFVAGDQLQYYDATGKIILTEEPLLFEDIVHNDPTWAARLLRYCRD